MHPTLVLAIGLVACAPVPAAPVGLPVLGAGAHSEDGVTLRVVADASDGLVQPSDVSIDPNHPGELWITNYGDDSITRLQGEGYAQSRTYKSVGSEHFLARPMSLAFAEDGRFATAQDTDEKTQGNLTPPDFMGPTLWDDSSRFDGGHDGHLDMLHNSPSAGGIASETDAVYWVFDGYHGAISRYDFGRDHGYGGSDHSDGSMRRYVEGDVARDAGEPSHLDLDHETGLLYVADPGHGRIAVLDTATGTQGGWVGPDYDGDVQVAYVGADLETLVSPGLLETVVDDEGDPAIDPTSLARPGGLELHDGLLFVTDTRLSAILAFTLDGLLVDWLRLDRPGARLGGLELTEDGALVVTDMAADEVLLIQPLEQD